MAELIRLVEENMKGKILVVDDDKSMVSMIRDILEMEDYIVSTAFDGEQALIQSQKQPDIILLDINLPKMDGIEVCEKIRDFVHCPILFLSARIEEKDRIMGLKVGGDDYIVKPFSIGELLARIEAHLRREARIQGKTEFRYDNNLIINLNSRKMTFENHVIELTKSEFDIVVLLSRHPGQVFDREMIYEKLWGLDRDGDNRNVTELIRRIRNKIRVYTDKEFIETVWGCGYRWAAK